MSSLKASGYRGIWYELPQHFEHGPKYSGGLGTYTAKHVPLAIYAPQVNKTFFVYGGARADGERHLLAMASYYDHNQHIVPRPTIVHDKQGVDDPHDNPSIAISEDGHVWVFVSGRAKKRPGFIYRGRKPYSIDDFELVSECEITYPQPWWIKGRGFLHLFTQYTGVRELYWSRSANGRDWTPPRKLAGLEGHYQTSRALGGRVITAFNRHPGGTPDTRTDLYYLETDNLGETWRTAAGEVIDPPLTDADNPARVRHYEAEGRLCYMKDIGFDRDGNPVILHIASRSAAPGPAGDPRIWTIAHWQGDQWAFREVTRSTANYDMGSMDLTADPVWRIIAPTQPGPQHWGTGGEVAIWISPDQGVTWSKTRDVTTNSMYNHSYVRRPIDAHRDFDAFWADGHPTELTPSRLYFTNRDGDNVWMLPADMDSDFAEPILL
jgi:hypothetical protein